MSSANTSVSQRLALPTAIDRWSLIVAVKDEAVLHDTLLRSADIDGRCQIITKRDYSSAAKAYNEAAAEATSEVLVFAHTDVYLPEGWLTALARALDTLSRVDPNWGVLGVCGRATNGQVAGHVYSTGSQAVFGQAFDGLVESLSLDEMLLVTRRSAGLQFDENLGFHLYGTDVCYEAKRRGMKSYVMSAFCIHNSNGIRTLPSAFWRSYFLLRHKWWTELPIHSCCAEITKGCWPFVRSWGTTLRQLVVQSSIGARVADPAKLYRYLLSQGLTGAEPSPHSEGLDQKDLVGMF